MGQKENKAFDTQYQLSGKLLLAMPSIDDPRFHRAVIFICAHDENGAMGLVVNHHLPNVDFSKLLTKLGISSDITVDNLPIMSGGPVDSARGFLLHTSDFKRADTIEVDEDFSVTGTVEALKQLVEGKGPQQALFILGYAGWGADQLEREIQNNAWLLIDPDPSIIFHAKPDEKWAMAMNKLGFDLSRLSAQAGTA